jgi:hypothetical protein
MDHGTNKHSTDDKRMAQLRERAMNDPLVHAQLVEMMEEDPDLVNIFSKHVQKKYGSKWDELQPDEKALLIKKEMSKNRIPRKGGRKTKKLKSTKRKSNTKKNRRTKRRSGLKRK